ncbi:MAG: hypothetical protein K2X35_00295 [Bryobacteraceae bacterium]|nr:hypothetical protein [Bryobacteraceae bacterium]
MRSLLLLLALLLASCSEAPKKEAVKEPEKPAAPVTGRQAFQYLYPAARIWAQDAAPIQGRSIRIGDVPEEPGKAGAWEFTFASTAKGRIKSWTYSVTDAQGNLHKGTFAGQEASFSGTVGQARPFLLAALRHDSDEAYQVAVKESEAELKKLGERPVLFLLELTTRFPNPAWRVIWGESLSTSEYSVFVDASTGQMLQKVK